MTIKEHPIIIFLDRRGFLIYQDTLSNVWQFPFSQELVQNLDVINRIQLVNSIGSFIQTNKIMPSSLIIVLADSVIFQKDLISLQKSPESPQEDQQEEIIKKFLDNVPFEEILAKVINNTRVVAANKDLLETIADPFKKIGCVVEAIVPGFMYQKYTDFSHGLNHDIVRMVLQQDLLKLGNMLTGQKTVETKQESIDQTQNESKEKTKNTRQFVLIGIFVILLIVLAVVYFTLGRTSQTPSVTNVSQSTNSLTNLSPSPAVSVEPTISLEASVSAVLEDAKTINITIVENQETEVIANALKNLLTGLGFQSITIIDSTDPLPARSSVLFSKSIPESLQQKIIAEIKKIFPDIIVQESEDLESVITIIVGKSA